MNLLDAVRLACPCSKSSAIVSKNRLLGTPASEQPAAYLKICAMLVPKEMKVEPSSGVKAMSDEQLDAAPDALCEILAARAGEAAKNVIEGTAELVALPLPRRSEPTPARKRPQDRP